jgi:hypothetical protein
MLPTTSRPIPNDSETYEVFKGLPEGRPFRLGGIRGSRRAIDMMYRMFDRVPGDYFILHSFTGEIVASIQPDPQPSA